MATTSRPSCCIIGAGAAGLAAAQVLVDRGWDVTIKEARAKVGGRCSTVILGGTPVDLGAEFSHGRTVVLDLAEQIGIAARPSYTWDESAADSVQVCYAAAGRFLSPDSPAMRAMHDFVDRAISGVEGDVSMETALQRQGADPTLIGLIDGSEAVEYATNLEHLGLCEWRRRELFFDEYTCSTDYSMQGKYGTLMEALATRVVAAGARLELSTPVRSVRGGSEEALVDGVRFDVAIVTVPLGVLKAGDLLLDGVHSDFRRAVDRISFGPATKLIMVVIPRSDGSQRLPAMLVMADGFARQIWTRAEPDGRVVVSAFFAGPRDAAATDTMSCDAIAKRVCDDLAALCGLDMCLVDAVLVRWGADPWSRGAYSSPTVGMESAWRQLEDTGCPTVRYAGEAAHQRGSTVDSAFESGRAAAAAADARRNHSQNAA